MNKILASFIIPHKGREQLLIETIQSICQQDFDLAQIEIILVSQNDVISDEIDALKSKISLSVFQRPEGETISALRNYGAKYAKGDYFIFIDADIFLSENWLSTMLTIISEDNSCALVSAVQKDSDHAPVLERIRTVLSNVTIDNYVDFLPGRNLFLKKETFFKVGGFPEHMLTCEDFFFTDKVNKLGKLFYTSRATYIHLGEDKNYKGMFYKEIWRGQSNLISIKGRDIPLNEWPSLLIPPAIFILFLLLLISIAILNVKLVFLFLFLLFLPVIVYSLRLKKHAKQNIGLWPILKFYALYFPARTIGTIGGLFKSIGTNSHNE